MSNYLLLPDMSLYIDVLTHDGYEANLSGQTISRPVDTVRKPVSASEGARATYHCVQCWSIYVLGFFLIHIGVSRFE